MSAYAPIAIFAFRRAAHLARTLDGLQQCPDFGRSKVFVYCDGPRSPSDEFGVREVRELLAARRSPNMQIVLRETNVGLANSIIGAVSELTQAYGRVIVIEDDLVVQPATLKWLNDALARYRDEPRVMQVSAYQYFIPEFAHRETGSFQRFATTWGWATWDRAWAAFDRDATGWEQLRTDPTLQREFDAGGVYPFSEMLVRQMSGKLDSWGIRWSWSVFRNGGVTLMPPRSLVQNIGFDASATHNSVGRFKKFATGPSPLLWTNLQPPLFPDTTVVEAREQASFRRGLLRTHALRNSRIKRALGAVGLKRFSA